MKKIKVLKEDMTSPFQNFKYELGQRYTAKGFDKNKFIACSNGLYATDIEGLSYSWNIHRRAFECEVGGRQVIYDQFKQRFEHLTLIREIKPNELKERALKKESEIDYKLSEVLFPVNPLAEKAKKVTEEEIELLRQWVSVRNAVWVSVGDSIRNAAWASVGDSVWDSIRDAAWDSVWDSVWDSIRDAAWASVGNSVQDSIRDAAWDSVGDSVGAYISSLFLNITDWRYIENEEGKNPFQSGIDLWKRGFVPSFDEEIWKLHSGEKAKVVFKINENCIKKL